jgi:N-methylhydantoinase A/oxoprolinase/acetone carboxylase beta subunit
VRIGVDVGGTNTDAAIIDGRAVLATAKRPTTADVTSGIVAALRAVLDAHPAARGALDAIMIGTTHFTNAVIQRRDLVPTAAIRLGLPATSSVPPLEDWPADLRAAIGNHTYMIHGGFEFDGRPIAPPDPAELDGVAADLARRGIRAAAISGVFAPTDPQQEEWAAVLLRDRLPDLDLTLSHEIGRLGLLERENAAVLNACLAPLARRTVAAFREAVAALGLDPAPRLYLSQNDGTLMDADYAARYPVLTFASGPTNSMRGAAFLSGLSDAIVLDVGGTTTDAGVLVGGFPREASFEVSVGGVRTNFRMPDLVSVGLGGGSIVAPAGDTIGPTSVGFRLRERARVFGGDTLTATDIAVAAGLATLGDPTALADLDPATVAAARASMRARIADLIDTLKTTAAPAPVIVVGGGGILIEEPIVGASAVIRPPHHDCANAIGAAIAQVSGETDRIFPIDGRTHTRESALAAARDEARDRAIAAGADPATVTVVELEELPLAYLPSNALRVRAKVAGDLMSAMVPTEVGSAHDVVPPSQPPNSGGSGAR